MQYAQIINGSVKNIILADAEFAATLPGLWVECSSDIGIGYSYENGVFTAPVVPVIPIVDPCQWLIDIGPFYDRFGTAKMAVLTSSDAAVKAIMQDVNIRKWVDLQCADVAQEFFAKRTVV